VVPTVGPSTPTALPPTATPENEVPVISIDSQAILPGETFATFELNQVVQDAESPDEEISWSFAGNEQLEVDFVEGVAHVSLPDENWVGSENIVFEACDPDGACSSAETRFWVMEKGDSELEVTYLENSGFLITAGDQKILIDALFYGSHQDALDMIARAEPPFDGIDLILVTHSHDDHFAADLVVNCLAANPEAILVGPAEVYNAMPFGKEGEWYRRSIPIHLQEGESRRLVVNDIGVEALYLFHGPENPVNLGYVITIDGYRLLHTGDWSWPDPERYDFASMQIDVLMILWGYLDKPDMHEIVLDFIQPKYLIPIHWTMRGTDVFDIIGEYFDNAVFFRESMDSWVMPAGE